MIWFAWRQLRTQTWITIGALAVFGVVLAISGRDLAKIYAASGIATCATDCDSLVAIFLRDAQAGLNGTLYQLALGAVYAVPALIGLFWGAPLVARELEAGTYRLAWNQSVTRTRWLATKLATVGLAGIATAGLLSLGVSWWAQHIDQTALDRITPLVFGARGVVPIAYAAFALAVGVTAGMLLRRTVPAMAATLAVYVGAVAVMPVIRGNLLVPTAHTTLPLDTTRIDSFGFRQDGSMHVFGDADIPGAWVLSNQTITPAGQVFTGPADPQYCGVDHGPKACLDWVGTLGLRQDLTYQPANHFWPLQWAETGMFLAAALLLTGFCFWWIRRRLT
jgi:hypothetical protein